MSTAQLASSSVLPGIGDEETAQLGRSRYRLGPRCGSHRRRSGSARGSATLMRAGTTRAIYTIGDLHQDDQ